MAVSFKWTCSYQNEVEYAVLGHPFVKRIEAYSVCRHGLLEYQRSIFNGDDAEFARTMAARQGGVLIRYVEKPYRDDATYWADQRFPMDFYLDFVQWLKDEYAKHLVEHERRRIERGWTEEEFPACERSPIPKPMFYNPDSRAYEVEPWFQPSMAAWEPECSSVAARAAKGERYHDASLHVSCGDH